MIIRKLTDKDAYEHEKLASQAFVFSYDPSGALPLPSEIMLGAFNDDGRLAADMEIYDRVCFFGNTALSCAAVGGVASKPEYRRGGAVRAMLEEISAGNVIGKKWDISVLYPFSAAYYKKLGYAPVGAKLRISVPFAELKDISRAGGAVLYEGKEKDSLLRIYNAWARNNALAFRRDDTSEWNKEPYSTGIYTYLMQTGGEYRSYAVFSLDRAKSEVSVKELAYLDKESLFGILGFLRCFDGNFDTVVFENEPISSPLPDIISDRSKAKISYSHAGAIKLLNTENVLKKHVYPEKAGCFTFCAAGETWEVNYAGGCAEVKKTDKKAVITADRTAAAKLLLEGVRNTRELEYSPGVEINGNADDFVRAFPLSEIYFNDSF